jgi:hypothetical protein
LRMSTDQLIVLSGGSVTYFFSTLCGVGPLWDVELDSSLTKEQVDVVRRVLREECHAFARDDDDIGCAPELQLDIELHDKTPVQTSY